MFQPVMLVYWWVAGQNNHFFGAAMFPLISGKAERQGIGLHVPM